MSSKGKDAYKYEKIYKRQGILTKKAGSGRYTDEGMKKRWDKYGHSNEGKEYFSKILKLKPQSLLDIGCGYNEFCQSIKRQSSIKAVGSDIACPGADFIAPAHSLPFIDNEFDLITSFDCMEHIPEEEVEPSFKEFARVGQRIFLKVCLEDTPTKIDGEGLHVCVKEAEWWIEQADKYFVLDRKSVHVCRYCKPDNCPHRHLILFGSKK